MRSHAVAVNGAGEPDRCRRAAGLELTGAGRSGR
jgi:hypothetical protein